MVGKNLHSIVIYMVIACYFYFLTSSVMLLKEKVSKNVPKHEIVQMITVTVVKTKLFLSLKSFVFSSSDMNRQIQKQIFFLKF